MASAEIDLFIQEQKQRLAADRQRLGNGIVDQRTLPGGASSGSVGGPTNFDAAVSTGSRRVQPPAVAPSSTSTSTPPPSLGFPFPQANNNNGGDLFSKLGAYEQTRRAFDESRREEYRQLHKPAATAGHPTMSSGLDGAAGGLGIVGGLRNSAVTRQRKERERNAEYNDFLRQKEQEQQRKRQLPQQLPQQQQQQQQQQPRLTQPVSDFPPPLPMPQAPSNRVDFTSLDDLERRVMELRNQQGPNQQPPPQPPPQQNYYYQQQQQQHRPTISDDPVRRLEQLEAEYDNLRRALRQNNPTAGQTNPPNHPRRFDEDISLTTAGLSRLEIPNKSNQSTTTVTAAGTGAIGGAIDTRRPDTANQRERKRQAYKAELERQLAEQKQQKQQQQQQRPSLQEQSNKFGFGEYLSTSGAGQRTPKPSLPSSNFLDENFDLDYNLGIGNYPSYDQPSLTSGSSAAAAAAPSRVRFNDASTPAPRDNPVGGGGSSSVLSLGTEQERKAQAAARQKADYAKELERQMAEKKAAEARRKREREEFELKKEREIAAYDPFGKGGGGAPIKDAQGNTRANLKQLIRETEDNKLTGREGTLPHSTSYPAAAKQNYSPLDNDQPTGGDLDWMDQLNSLKDLQTKLSKSFTEDLNLSGGRQQQQQQQLQRPEQKQEQQQPQQHARGGHGIFGRGLSDEQKRQRERYQEELRQQVEEQRRAKEEERRRLAEEDLREQRRAEEQQRRMLAEAEAERRRQAEKDEAIRRRNEELRLAAEEQKKLAAGNRQRRQQDDRASPPPAAAAQGRQPYQQQQQQQNRFSPRSSSPPVPAIRTQMEAPQPPPPQQQQQQKPSTPRRNQQQQHQRLGTAGSAASAPEPESIEQLARLRNQLRSERRRIEEALDHGSAGNGAGTYRVRGSSAGNQIDVFDMARDRRKPVAAKRNIIAASSGGAAAAAAAAGSNQSGENRRRYNKNDYLDDYQLGGLAPSDLGLGLGGGNAAFESMQLDSESAFVDIDQPLSPSRFDYPQTGGDNPDSPTVSLDVERIDRANEARLKRLQRLQADAVSLNDPEEVLNRFMSRQARPISGQTGHGGDE